ncbi:MAG: hypothetical protein KF754_03605 [Planctomycetes bacterium]|nr:hypothetical protein [Planctomycetota bacterium]
MSTIMVDPAACERLSRQFDAAMQRSSGRDMEMEARRFVGYLCDRLERNNHMLMAAPRNLRPDAAVKAGYSARQGESVLMTCLFLLNDLAARVGRREIADYLVSTQTRAGRALARRVQTRQESNLRVASVRFSVGDGVWRPREILAQAAPFAGTGSVHAGMRFRGCFPGALKIGLVIENEGFRTSHFVGAHVKLYAQFEQNAPWVATQGEAFAFLEKVAPMEAQVIALRGFDCMDLLRGADALNRDPIAVRILARVV